MKELENILKNNESLGNEKERRIPPGEAHPAAPEQPGGPHPFPRPVKRGLFPCTGN